ncbi:MAG: esterase [Massilia sp.]|nr:esterase [Massilia sp.]
MRQTNIALALLTAAVLAACGGNGSTGGDQTLKNKFSAQVTFGDSLADVGTYKVGTVAALGGGQFTVNGNNTAKDPVLTGKNWSELMAAQFGLAAPCPAVTGLDGNAEGFLVPVVAKAGCFGYAMGGARVTNPVGPGNKLAPGSNIGALTYPVTTQIANHLAVSGGKFSGTEVVFVMAGGNDALMLLGQLSAAATDAGQTAGAAAGQQAFASSLISQLAAGATNPATAAQAIGAAMQTEAARTGSTPTTVIGAAVAAAAAEPGNSQVGSQTVYGPMVVKAQADATAAGNTAGAKAGADYLTAHGPEQVAAMSTAGTELAALVKTQIVAKGASFVVVNNLPDVSISPSSKAQPASTQALIKAMANAFNASLKAGIAGEAKVLYVDLFTLSVDQSTNPGPYGLTNTTTPVCATNPLGGSSLGCNGSNLIAGDVGHYMFADSVHPTPFEHSLVARYIAEQMIVKGWL